jgi:CheY-like chemotaxis protein
MADFSKKMLIVEDEVLIRMCAVDLAEEAGYTVLEAGDVDVAMAVLAEHGDISLLFTDVNLPGKRDGLDLARHVEAEWPRIRLVIASGKPIPESAGLSAKARYLPKPYGAAAFMNAIGDMPVS